MNQVCKCGKGHVSLWDNKCGKCRTKKEQKDHLFVLDTMSEGWYDEGIKYYVYKGLRRLYK